MLFNGNSGRYRHLIKVLVPSKGTDATGVPVPFTELCQKRCEVDVKSGSQLNDYDTTLTSEIITVLLRYDPRIKNNHVVEWEGVKYDIHHIKPDRHKREMVMTCEVKTK